MSDRERGGRRLEESFFSADGDVVAARAAAFAHLDPRQRPERSERRVFAGVLALTTLVVAVLAWMAPTPGAAPTERKSAAAQTAPASPPSQAVESAEVDAPPPSRLAAVLHGDVPAAPPPAVAAPATAAPVDDPAVAAARKSLESEDFEGAIAALDRAPAGFDRQALRGFALYELGRDQEALEALKGALTLRPDHAETLLLLGSLQQTQDPVAAGATYRAFLAAHPEAPEAAEVRTILERI
ncbi:MAG: hypothetical protein H6706_01255 [Myxococcales bacterium]|nr:hypothetical protein [Myxococcales bacterium]